MIADQLKKLKEELPEGVTLVAVSKTKPVSDILEAYQAGQRDFGENKIQEMVEKHPQLPADIRWHMIGHLQTNKIKYIAGFVSLIHGVDKLKTLKEIDKQAAKHRRVIDCLLQIKIAEEETKFGFDPAEAEALLQSDTLKNFHHLRVVGLMGMATFTDDANQIRQEFAKLKQLYNRWQTAYSFKVLSMGMSQDFLWAIEQGSNLVRIGSKIFGDRQYN